MVFSIFCSKFFSLFCMFLIFMILYVLSYACLQYLTRYQILHLTLLPLTRYYKYKQVTKIWSFLQNSQQFRSYRHLKFFVSDKNVPKKISKSKIQLKIAVTFELSQIEQNCLQHTLQNVEILLYAKFSSILRGSKQ